MRIALIGAVLGTMLFLKINGHVPDDWGAAGWASWLMQADTTQAEYKYEPIDRDNPRIAAVLRKDTRLGNAYADALHKCEVEGTGGALHRGGTVTSAWVGLIENETHPCREVYQSAFGPSIEFSNTLPV